MSLFVPALIRALNANGRILSGATWTFYIAGTTTLAPIFSDDELTTPLANPIAANSGGAFVSIYLDPRVTYRAVLKTSAGALLQDIDPYDDGAAPGDLTAISFQQSGTGAVTRPAQAKLREIVSATDFGANGSGGSTTAIANANFAAFSAALAYVQGLATDTEGSGAPELYIPAGTYYLGANTIDNSKPLQLRGAGMFQTTLKWSGATGLRLQHFTTQGATGVTGAGSGTNGSWQISDLHLDGGYAGGAEADYHAIHARTTLRCQKLYISSWPGEGVYERAELADSGVRGNCNGSRWRNNLIVNCRKGLFAKGSDCNGSVYSDFNLFANRQWAAHLECFGSTLVTPSAENNSRTTYGNGTTVPVSHVSHSGNWYTVVPGQEAWASTNAPTGAATNNQGWAYMAAGGVDAPSSRLAWFNGISVRGGGAFYLEGLNNASTVIKPYIEDDEASFISQSSNVTDAIGGAHSWRLTTGFSLGGKRGVASAIGPNMTWHDSSGYNFSGLAVLGGVTLGAGNIDAASTIYVANQAVVGARKAAVADATVAAGATPTKAEFDALVGQVNALLNRLRAGTGHGLIA